MDWTTFWYMIVKYQKIDIVALWYYWGGKSANGVVGSTISDYGWLYSMIQNKWFTRACVLSFLVFYWLSILLICYLGKITIETIRSWTFPQYSPF